MQMIFNQNYFEQAMQGMSILPSDYQDADVVQT